MRAVCQDPGIEAQDALLHRYISSTSRWYLLSLGSPNELYGASVGMDGMSVVAGWGRRGLEHAHSPKMQYTWRQGLRALSASACACGRSVREYRRLRCRGDAWRWRADAAVVLMLVMDSEGGEVRFSASATWVGDDARAYIVLRNAHSCYRLGWGHGAHTSGCEHYRQRTWCSM
jgi:hypothetical protein